MKRDARQSRPQLVLVLADNSTSMSEGSKAQAATAGIREMICQCQLKSPPGKDCYRIGLIRFAMQPELVLQMVPAREIDINAITIHAGWLSVHSDYGPAGQDKPENQDFALLWLPTDDRPRSDLHWAAALADGVTCSFRPEGGAKLACFHALASLVSGASPSSPFERAVSALNAAGDALGELARQIAEQGDDFRPADEFPATWRMRLERGQLLQTTLTLAWLEGETLSVGMIGDGGAALRAGQDEGSDEMVLASGELELDLVHALGPANCRVEALDLWHQSPFTLGATLAL